MKHHSSFRLTYRLGILLLTSSLISSCKQPDPLYHQQLYVFGTFVELTFWKVPEDTAQHAATQIAADLQTMHRNWHAWQPSLLTNLNGACAAGQTYTVPDASLLFMLKQAKQWSIASDGLFNPAIGKLIALWGFHRDDFSSHPPPSASAIAELLAQHPTMDDLSIEGQQVSSRNPAVQLDLGAIAKGYAVDLALERLRTLGIQNAIVNAGGNLKVIGSKDGTPWSIGIRHPSQPGEVLATLKVSGEESVITSGDYERFFEYQGFRYTHIIDPRTGQPTTDLASVTVVDKSGALADAMATALVIAGAQKWPQLAKQMGLNYVMAVDKKGIVYLTPAMAKRVQFDPVTRSLTKIIEVKN